MTTMTMRSLLYDDTTCPSSSTSSSSQVSPLVLAVVVGYFLLELCFVVLFYGYLKPRANCRRSAYKWVVSSRDYPQQRYLYMMRLLELKEQTALRHQPGTSNSFSTTLTDPREMIADLIRGWFHPMDRPFDNLPLPSGSKVIKVKQPIDRRQPQQSKQLQHLPSLASSLTSTTSTSTSTSTTTAGVEKEGEEDSLMSTSVSASIVSRDADDLSIDNEEETKNSTMAALPTASSSAASPPVLSFHYNHPRSQNSNNTNEDHQDDNNGDDDDLWTIRDISRQGVDQFIAWAFFSKQLQDLENWERVELEQCHQLLKKRFRLVFVPFDHDHENNNNQKLVPYRHTLENVNALHRPLIVYLVLALIKTSVECIMRVCLGFTRVVSPSTGLVAWWRPPVATVPDTEQQQQQQQPLPLLFFHGVGPLGHVMYLPMILWGLCVDRRRAVLMFENPNISCALGSFDALSETETVRGVHELTHQLLGPKAPFVVAAHSFGCCLITWLLHAHDNTDDNNKGGAAEAFRQRIRQCVLLDPVTLLLSDSDVLVNFLYTRRVRCIHDLITRLAASSELFVEHYLRRHFFWYNSELILSDIPDHIQTLVVLSAADNIVPTRKIQQHIHCFHPKQETSNEVKDDESNHDRSKSVATRQRKQVDLIYWDRVGHGACVSRFWKCAQDVIPWMTRTAAAAEVTNTTPQE